MRLLETPHFKNKQSFKSLIKRKLLMLLIFLLYFYNQQDNKNYESVSSQTGIL